MQTRRDHMQAYQFAMGRLATALVTGDPGRGDSPTKRAALGSFFGAGLVVLLSLGFLVYGKLSPVTTAAWREPGSIVVEKETGTRYLFLDGRLRPVRNYASALLLTGKGAAVRTVAAKALSDVPHGAPIGIDGAPDSLPTPATLLAGSWTDCLRPDLPSGHVVDFAPGTHAGAFPAGRQLLLKSPSGQRFVLWRGTKYPVPAQSALIALGLDGDRPVAASAAWLAAVPTGAALAPAKLDRMGESAGQIAGRPTAVGQLFTMSAAGAEHTYVMTAGGVAQVSSTEAALLAARPGAPAIRQVSVTDIASARVSAHHSLDSGVPDVLGAPAVDTSGQAVCLRESAQGARLSAAVVVESGAAATGKQRVLVPPSHGVYAVDQREVAAQVANPHTFLITDQGVVYPLGSSAAQSLGIGGGTATALPESLLVALPHGPVLDRSVAALTVKAGQDGATASPPADSGRPQGTSGVGRTSGKAPVPAVSADPSPTGSAARVG
ncbi:type VII secretion protein EccB [Streptomyces griseofuscus]|uniref:type VII secretion protein EccB n=1 Tax=Streptomyces TaxID=1883 RepID=UPI0018F0A4A1|nr:type VII secretion protein EccB [Streptomyces sp. CRPSP2-6A1]MBJ6999331.1 type VII secretion protein EccB [Streptomyces sp. CRPSP2-6A1]